MNTSDFLTDLLPLVQERLPEGFRVSTREIEKNNGVSLTGLCLCSEERQGGSAILYPEQFLCALNEGYTMEDIAEEVTRSLLMPVPREIRNIDLSDPEFILRSVILKLVGSEKNSELQRQALTRPWLDMLLVAALLIDGENCGSGVAILTREMLRKSGLREEEIFEYALENTREKLGETLRSVDQILTSGDEAEEADELPEEKLYVLSNRKYCLGAAALYYSEKVRRLAKRLNTDLYILPSSIHEVILVPAREVSEEFLHEIIGEANRIERRQEEILTDSLYCYHLSEDRIVLVEE